MSPAKIPNNDALFRILAPHFTAGFTLHHGRVARAAPILRWTIGRTLHAVEDYCVRRGWVLDRVPREEC